MNNTDKSYISRFESLKSLYSGALSAMSDRLDIFERNIRQYNGSDEIDGSPERAATVRNITYEIIESEIDYEIPVPKASTPCYSEVRERNARTVERLCSAVRDALPFEEMNDQDERQTYIYGASVWYVEWNGKSEGGIDGIRVHCISPTDFIPQPGVCRVEDMDYCFLRFTTTCAELKRSYGVTEGELETAECDLEGGEDGAATVTVAFYKGEDMRVGKLVFSGDLLLLDIPSYYARKIKISATDGEENAERTPKFCDLEVEHIAPSELSGGAAESADVPYYMPESFPIVIRKNSASMSSLYSVSDCDRIRPQQQAINKVESRILQKLLRAGITPIMPEDATVSLGNSVFGQVIRMRPGESAESYGKIDTTPDISQDVEEADRLYEHARRVLGISDALQGTDNEKLESGYARQLKIAQASSRLESKKRMKYLAYSELYKLIFCHFLAFSDGECQLSFKDGYGRVHSDSFRRYDFLEKGKGGYEYFDGFLFSVDLNVGSEYKREALWERNLTNLEAGALGDKSSPYTLLRYWQCQQRAGYPYAADNVSYFNDAIKNAEKSKNKESENENESK